MRPAASFKGIGYGVLLLCAQSTGYPYNFHVRSKIVENLAAVNYDTNNLDLAAYDWRLSYSNLEERDGYFSKLKTTIERLK